MWKKVSFNEYSFYPESFGGIQKGRSERFKFEIDATTLVIRFCPFFGKNKDWSVVNL